ncbi:hypothetical protein Gpo141_00011065 [Globisporangium polare]
MIHQVDADKRLLAFMRSQEGSCKSFSCSAVIALPELRLALEPTTQSTTTTTSSQPIVKKAVFSSTEHRANFLVALEEGNLASKSPSSSNQSTGPDAISG